MGSITDYDRPPSYAAELLERKTDPVHRMRTPFTPSMTSLRRAQTPGQARRLRSTELRRSLSAAAPKAARAKPYMPALTRRAKSATNLEYDVEDDVDKNDDDKIDEDGASTDERPWGRDTWLKLDKYYQEENGNFEETCKRFYRFESLYREEGSPRVLQRWSKKNIMRRIALLDQVTRKHKGQSLVDRVRSYERKVRRKRLTKEARQERARHVEQKTTSEHSKKPVDQRTGLRAWISYLFWN